MMISIEYKRRQTRTAKGAMESNRCWFSSFLLLLLIVLFAQQSEAFSITRIITPRIPSTPATATTRRLTTVTDIRGRVEEALWYKNQNNDNDLLDDDDYDNDYDIDEPTSTTTTTTTTTRKKASSSRWASLNPKIKQRVVQVAQERAIANKMKREPTQDKKRRMMMFVKEKQQERKSASRVQRLLSFDDRTPLAALIPGMEMSGLVISLTNFGAYVDVGTQCDGLLHISQISRDFFVEHPRQVLTPGDEIAVQVRSVDASRNKLHLTMLPRDVWVAEKEQQRTQQLTRNSNDNSAENDNHFLSDRIPLAEIQIDDELWGELRRVTDYGAYVEVGAVVDGWLHFMDHPEAACHVGGAPQGLQQKSKQQQQQQRPSDFMKVGDRVRVWVADVNHEQQRIKLTALRPPHLPGPRREL